jgi:hypothetical protein
MLMRQDEARLRRGDGASDCHNLRSCLHCRTYSYLSSLSRFHEAKALKIYGKLNKMVATSPKTMPAIP